MSSQDHNMRRLASRMLAEFPKVRRWEETDDILQESSIRLHHALQVVEVQSELHHKRIAAQQIRRVLIDFARKYASCEHFAGNHETGFSSSELHTGGSADVKRTMLTLDDWTAFHEAVQGLPDKHRVMFDLLWYDELSSEQVASLLSMNIRMVQRRWIAARVALGKQLASRT